MAKKPKDGSPTVGDVYTRNAANISRADRGPKLKSEHLSELIATYILEAARVKQCHIRELSCPPPREWGQGVLPTATRLRLGNPDIYPDAKAAMEGEFERTKGNLLLPPTVRAGVAAKLVEYSVWYPPSPVPSNVIVSKLVVGRGNTDSDPDSYACCLVPPPSVLNGLQIARTISQVTRTTPRVIKMPDKTEIETATGMKPDLLCPFSMPERITFCLDPSVMAMSEIAIGAGAPDTMLVMAPNELKKLPNAFLVPGLITRMKSQP